MAVRIVTDSSCDLPDKVVAELGITIVPLAIRFGSDELLDRVELSTDEFWRRCAASAELPTTAAPPPGAFEAAFRDLIAAGADGIVAVCLSGALSATLQSAQLAATAVAADVPAVPVTVIDSRLVSLGLGVVATACARAARDGADHDAVVALAHDLIERTRVWGTLDTLENLKKGGRIGNAKALLASVLAIKPIIEVRDGKVEEGGKQRTRRKAIAFLLDKLDSYGGVENLAVLNGDCDDIDEFLAALREHYAGDVMVGDIGPVVGSHAGRGTIGLAFQLTG
jgi:DegV family protein with EDD domain